MLCGFLPFDHESSIKEIARKTVNEKLPMPKKAWKDLSEEVKSFVEGIHTNKYYKRVVNEGFGKENECWRGIRT